MNKHEVYTYLCYYDKRNPSFIKDEFLDNKEPRKDCLCDNCFYNRDKLALEILKYIEGVNHA